MSGNGEIRGAYPESGNESPKNTVQQGESSAAIKAGETKEKGPSSEGKVPASDWRKLFSASANQSLRFFPPKPTNGTSIVTPPSGVFEEGELLWKNAVVAQFVGRIPNFSVFQKMVNLLWGEDGEVDSRPAGHNLFVLQFPNSQTRDRVIESGPWHIQNKPLIVRRWEPGMRSLEFNMAKLPLWIHLSNIPLELFTQTGISYIASVVGNPL